MDLTTATPVEIDTELAELHYQWFAAANRAQQAYESVMHIVGQILHETKPVWQRRSATYDQTTEFLAELEAKQAEDITLDYREGNVLSAMNRYEGLHAEAEDLREQMRPYNEEFTRRGGWSRAYLVTNANGHVHSSMECSTCFETTPFFWVVEYSGSDEIKIVKAAGQRACTVCYPTAPVEVLKRPTQMFSKEEKEVAARKAEAAAKKAERDAAKITLDLYTENWRTKEVSKVEVTYKTLRALQNDTGALVREMHGAHALINGFDLELSTYKGQPHMSYAEANLEVMLDVLFQNGVDTTAFVAKQVKRAEKER